MPKQTLGITATELFACNPYRILGVPVNSTADEIAQVYKDLLAAAQSGNSDTYKTEFDFPSLPPFTRDEQTVRTSYVKLASNGYRCFAYADGEFSVSLNVDDVALNINDITCYDCFLRCYMWLVVNDRKFEERALWVPLAQYIDKMIMSSPEQWNGYFDHRFPEEMNDDKMTSLRSFYSTFCDIILLPIKELARGTMKCRTAMEILNVVGISEDEPIPKFDIPQANKPKPGEPAPKLKIAVKDGEEYFDVNAGKAVSFAAKDESKAQIEHNTFSAASTKISADAILSDDDYVKPVEVQEAPKPSAINSAAFTKPAAAPQQPAPAVQSEPQKTESEDFVVPKKKKRVIAMTEETPASGGGSFSSFNDNNNITGTEASGNKKPKFNFDESITKQAQEAIINEDKNPVPYKKSSKGLYDIIESYDRVVEEDVVEEEESENAYADALVKMLRSNRSGSMMKSVETERVFQNGGKNDSLVSAPVTGGLYMDDINRKVYDRKRLNAENITLVEETDLKKVRDAKYRDININDMLNPNMGKGTKVGGGFEIDPIEQYKKDQARSKNARNRMWKWLAFAGIAVVLVIIMTFMDIL